MSRKILTLVLTSIFVLSFGLSAFAQTADQKIEITGGTAPSFADDINGLNAKVGNAATYNYLVSINTNGLIMNAASLGLNLYSPDGSLNPSGATVSNAQLTPFWNNPVALWGFGPGFNATMITGTLPEQILYGGVGNANAPNTAGGGIQNNSFAGAMTFDVTFSGDGVFCVDSAFFPPATDFLAVDENGNGIGPDLVGGSGDAAVGGASATAFCVTSFAIPDLPPAYSNCPAAQTVSHCDNLNYQVMAADPDPENQTIAYAAATTGAGTVSVDGSGNVTYMPDPSDVGASVTITVTASEIGDVNGPTSDCVTSVTVTNESPALACPADFNVGVANSNSSDPANGTDADGACDLLVYSLVSVTPGDAQLTITVNAGTGAVSATASATAAIISHAVVISMTDGIETVECTVNVTVKSATPFSICIGETSETFQGGHQLIDITYLNGSETIGGYNFLIQYDNSALSLAGANPGSIYNTAGTGALDWEMFDFRYGPNGNCSGGCPSGKVRIIGLADQNDGSPGGDVNLVNGDTFAQLDFLVTNDRTLECQFVPIRFCWIDCGDNSLSSGDGDTLFISNSVTDYTGSLLDGDQTFPTFTGAPDICDSGNGLKVPPRRLIDFCNGGIKIACADSIDDRGDINLNGISNEIADAVIYTQYFINGLSAFTELSQSAFPGDPVGQARAVEAIIAASDVNADGIPLSVADMVYLIRVIVGDALPFNKLAHNANSVEFSTQNGVVSTNTELGAALFVFAGNADVKLLASNMKMEVGVVDGNTHALVFDIGSERIAVGEVLNASSALISVEAVDYNGYALNSSTTLVPTTFVLNQNYPNPFNPSTKISFVLPSASEYTVTIYNVAGQKVWDKTGFAGSAGTVLVEWNASNQASGIYFYNVKTDKASATKKMALLK